MGITVRGWIHIETRGYFPFTPKPQKPVVTQMVVGIPHKHPKHSALPQLLGICAFFSGVFHHIDPVPAIAVGRFQCRHRRNIGDALPTVLQAVKTTRHIDMPIFTINIGNFQQARLRHDNTQIGAQAVESVLPPHEIPLITHRLRKLCEPQLAVDQHICLWAGAAERAGSTEKAPRLNIIYGRRIKLYSIRCRQ